LVNVCWCGLSCEKGNKVAIWDTVNVDDWVIKAEGAIRDKRADGVVVDRRTRKRKRLIMVKLNLYQVSGGR